MAETVTISFREGNERREALLVVEFPGSNRYARTYEGGEAERLWAELSRLVEQPPEAAGG